MKKFLLMLLFACCMSGAFAVGVAIELNAVHSQIKANQPEGLKSRHPQNKDPKRFFYREFFSDEEPGKEWKQYEISFVPDKTGSIVLGLSSTYFRERDIVYWIDYDKLEFINATGFVNPSFEELSYKKEFFRWRYYTKQSEKLNQNDAPDGKNYARVSRSYPIRQTIAVKQDLQIPSSGLILQQAKRLPPKLQLHRQKQKLPEPDSPVIPLPVSFSARGPTRIPKCRSSLSRVISTSFSRW